MSDDKISESTKIRKDINILCSKPAVSVICYLHKNPQTATGSKEESVPSESAPGNGFMPANNSRGGNLSGISKSNRLIISRTSSVNLLTTPTHITTEMKIRIQAATLSPGQFSPHILRVAKLELAFLLAKDFVSAWTDKITLENMINSEKENLCSTMIFTSVQVNCCCFLTLTSKGSKYK